MVIREKHILNEVRKEDDIYYDGCFWITADSFSDILDGKGKLEGIKYAVNFEGDETSKTPRKEKVHQSVWEKEYKNKYNKEYTYFPRGRVSQYMGKTYININPKINIPYIIDKIFEFYDLNRFDRANDIIIKEENGEHYKFGLK